MKKLKQVGVLLLLLIGSVTGVLLANQIIPLDKLNRSSNLVKEQMAENTVSSLMLVECLSSPSSGEPKFFMGLSALSNGTPIVYVPSQHIDLAGFGYDLPQETISGGSYQEIPTCIATNLSHERWYALEGDAIGRGLSERPKPVDEPNFLAYADITSLEVNPKDHSYLQEMSEPFVASETPFCDYDSQNELTTELNNTPEDFSIIGYSYNNFTGEYNLEVLNPTSFTKVDQDRITAKGLRALNVYQVNAEIPEDFLAGAVMANNKLGCVSGMVNWISNDGDEITVTEFAKFGE